jgi:hypothetical protein
VLGPVWELVGVEGDLGLQGFDGFEGFVEEDLFERERGKMLVVFCVVDAWLPSKV